MITKRAWSRFKVKSIDEDARQITGIATTPSVDRVGDIVDSMGAEFDLPLPFLWQHDSSQPVGNVIRAAPTQEGIPVTVQMASIDEPGTLKDRLDEAWQSLKIGLVKGLSIGFAPVEYSFMDNGGIHFTKWQWLELSAVTIAANQDASITSIKAADSKLRLPPSRKDAKRELDEYRASETYKRFQDLAKKCDVPDGIFSFIDTVFHAEHRARELATDYLKGEIDRLNKRIEALESLGEGAAKVASVQYLRSPDGAFVHKRITYRNGAVRTEALANG